MRPWWNRQTRYFEGVVSLARVRSSRIGLTNVLYKGFYSIMAYKWRSLATFFNYFKNGC